MTHTYRKERREGGRGRETEGGRGGEGGEKRGRKFTINEFMNKQRSESLADSGQTDGKQTEA